MQKQIRTGRRRIIDVSDVEMLHLFLEKQREAIRRSVAAGLEAGKSPDETAQEVAAIISEQVIDHWSYLLFPRKAHSTQN